MAEYIEYHPLKFWLDPASIAEIVAHIQTYLVNNPINSTTEIETIIHDYLIAHPEIIGGVRSINGETGEVVLTADNISGGENVTIKDVLDSLQDQIDDIIASIPSDYQQLINDVSDLKSALETDVENISNMVLPYTGKFLIPAPFIADTYIDVNNGGVLKRYVGWFTTQPVPLDGATSMYIPTTFNRYHAFYSGKTADTFIAATGVGNVTIPSGAKYVRFSFNSVLVSELDKVSTDKYGYDSVLADAITSRKQGLNSAERWEEFDSDADNLPINKIIQITYSTDVSNLPASPFSGTMITFDFDPESASKGTIQLAFKNSGEIYKRMKWGSTWRNWYQVVTADMLPDTQDELIDTAYKGLGNFIACGDSITVSLSYPTQDASGIPVKSWAKSFAEMCGSESVIYAQGGRDTAAFLASADYTAAVADTSQYAFLFFGINDCNGNVDIETYTANYTQIVNALLQNHKFVFCINIPEALQSSSRRTQYNNAIASVCNSVNKAFLVDITGANNSISQYKNYGHLSSIGYARLAGEIAKAVNVTMLANNYFDGQIDIDSQP